MDDAQDQEDLPGVEFHCQAEGAVNSQLYTIDARLWICLWYIHNPRVCLVALVFAPYLADTYDQTLVWQPARAHNT